MIAIMKAEERDIVAVAGLYDEIHSAEENGLMTIGWKRGIYPTEETAGKAFDDGELFVGYEGDTLVGCAIINQKQVDVYSGAPWRHDAENNDVMVLHTLVVSPSHSGKGYGTRFEAFYEEYARRKGCHYLRMDTNKRNIAARSLYRKLGFREIAIVPTVFNGLEGVDLVLLEKAL